MWFAGDLKRRVVIEQPREAVNALGETTLTWVVYATTWASVEGLNAREIVQSGRQQSVISYKVRMRRVPGITTRMRLRWNGGVLNVQSVLYRGSQLEDIELLCAEEAD
jgi:SPP1 family predicted phage head-tail adaptor